MVDCNDFHLEPLGNIFSQAQRHKTLIIHVPYATTPANVWRSKKSLSELKEHQLCNIGVSKRCPNFLRPSMAKCSCKCTLLLSDCCEALVIFCGREDVPKTYGKAEEQEM